MKKLDAKRVEALKEKYLKGQYVKKNWQVDEKDDLTLEEYAEYIDPTYKHLEGNPVIIEKDRKDKEKGVFYKMAFSIEGGGIIEYDLSYNHEFEEGDEINKDTLMFRTEKFLDKEHVFATGELV